MIKIIKATSEFDYQHIAHLASVIWKEHYIPIIGKKQVEYMLGKYQSRKAIKDQIKEGSEYFLIKHREVIIGYLSYYKKKESLFLSKIYIQKESRGNQIGKLAMQFIESNAKQLGCTCLSLTVNKDNTNSIKAYEKMGFINLGGKVFDIGNGFVMDDYLMEKKITISQ